MRTFAANISILFPAIAYIDRFDAAAGRTDYDHSGLLTVLEDLAGFRVCDAVPGTEGA